MRELVIVTHGHVATAAVHWWLGLGPEGWSRVSYRFDNASITHLSTDDRRILRLNDTAHLQA